MLILRIRQAEVALADGRLDEAFDLAQDADLRSHRHGQDLVNRLVKALVKRGREHLAQARHPQAFADAQKAARLGGNLPEISALQADVAAALMARQDSHHRKTDAIAAARQQLKDGQLTMAQNILADAHVNGEATDLHRELALRRAGVEPAVRRGTDALGREDWDGAIQAALDARRLHAASPHAGELAGQVTDSVLQAARLALEQGRIDRAAGLVQRLVPLAGTTVAVQEIERVVEHCNRAAGLVRQGQPRQAAQVLRQLTAIVPKAPWLSDAIAAAEQAAEGVERLQAGPLGLAAPAGAPIPERTGLVAGDEWSKNGGSAVNVDVSPATEQAGVPERFFLHVDGVGSYLVVRGRRVTVGCARSSSSPDVPLMSEPDLAAVTIERTDEDYFLQSAETVFVNGQALQKKLLAGGDQVALSARCRLRFAVPNAASTSAVLQLSGTRLPRTDARRVILMDRELIVGPGTASHVRADVLTEPLVLFVRDGQLCCRTKEPVMVGEQTLTSSSGLPMGKSVRIGPVSMVVTKV